MIKWGFFNTVTKEQMAIELKGRELYFSTFKNGQPMVATIDGLKLSLKGMIKTNPDLKNKPTGEIRKLSIQRLKQKIRSMKDIKEIEKYLVAELEPQGWKLRMIIRQGHRPIIIK